VQPLLNEPSGPRSRARPRSGPRPQARPHPPLGVDVARLHFFGPETGDAITAAAAPAAALVPQTA